MKYVSATYEPTPEDFVRAPGDVRFVRAVDEDGVVYSLPENSDVPPWPQYLADGGTIEEPPEPEPEVEPH